MFLELKGCSDFISWEPTSAYVEGSVVTGFLFIDGSVLLAGHSAAQPELCVCVTGRWPGLVFLAQS